MWRTPIGERTLRGREWELFREGLGLLKDQVAGSLDDPDSSTTGVAAVDCLQPASRLAMLAIVGKALHDEAEPCPELTALTEGTFASVYVTIADYIEVEIDSARDYPAPEDDEWSLPTLVIDAFREVTPEWKGSLPAPDCEDMGEWTFLLDMLMDRVLWDRDFEDEELFLDAEPRQGRYLKRALGIAGEYFTAIAPEPGEDELVAIRESLRQLCERPKRLRRPQPEEAGNNPSMMK